ncbi:MAG: DMT family transporter [Anaerolineae bacterium]|nr:DMT family transporter [Anaerolineae bacterium]
MRIKASAFDLIEKSHLMQSASTSLRAPASAYVVILLGILAVSLAAIFIRLAQAEGIPSLLIATSRMVIASLILTPFVLGKHRSEITRLQSHQLGWALVSGLFLAIHFASWIKSFEYTSVLVGVVLVTTSPLWAAILERIFLNSPLNRWVGLGLIIGIAGSVIVAIPANGIRMEANLGSILALIGAVAVAVYYVLGRKLRAHLSLLVYIWLVYGFAAIFLLIVSIATGIPVTGYSLNGYLWLIAIAIIPQIIGHSSFNYALKYFPASYVGVAGQLEPVLSSVIALFLFNEYPLPVQIIGSGVILVGVIIASLGQNRTA